MNSTNQETELDKKLEEEKALLEKQYDEVIGKTHKDLEETHIKKEYTFSVVEKRRLLQQQSILLMVQQAVDDIINLSVLPRLGVMPNPQIKVLYDVTLGKFTLWTVKEAKEEKKEESLPTKEADNGSD